MKKILLYATANDKKGYFEDIINLYNLSKHKTGVGTVLMHVAISKVNTLSSSDYKFVDRVKRAFKNHTEVKVKEVFFKDNIGRDFSSYFQLLMRAKESAQFADAYVFFRNRSARGPFQSNWYARFVEQFSERPNTSLCGNTINMYDHADRSFDIIPHVQSYAFLSTLSIMSGLDRFPGLEETTRIGVITKGEITLSQKLMNKGHKITSICEPSLWIGGSITNEIKKSSIMEPNYELPEALPFYHYQDLGLFDKMKRLAEWPGILKWFEKFWS